LESIDREESFRCITSLHALQIESMVFSTNVPDSLLGDHQVYVTLVMRWFSTEDDEIHTDLTRTMIFSMEGAIPNEPKTLVNFYLDRRTPTEELTWDSRDSALASMSDALRSDMLSALSELSSHTARWGRLTDHE
jgi:hypothetical protein